MVQHAPEGNVAQQDAGSTAPWLGLDSLLGQARRVMNCAGSSVFPRGYDDNSVNDHEVQPVRITTATGKKVEAASGKRSTNILIL